MTIVWDQLIVENTLLAGIIVGSIYLEQWGHKRSQINEDKESTKRIILFLADDLQKRLNFIEETHQYNDFKPFFTDMWDASCAHLLRQYKGLTYVLTAEILKNCRQ